MKLSGRGRSGSYDTPEANMPPPSAAAPGSAVGSLTAVPNSLLAGLGRLGHTGDPELVTLRQPLARALELHAVDPLGLQLLDQVVEFLLLLLLGLPLVPVL